MSDRPIRVAWISSVGEKGGAEVYMINFLRHLPEGRFRPGVILLRPGPLEAELRGLGWDVWVLARHRMRNALAVARSILQIRSIVRREGLDLLHSNGFRAHAYGGPAARLAGVPEVWSVHTAEQPGWSTRAILRIPTAHVTGNCPRTTEFFVRHGLPTSLIWPPVDLERLGRQTPRDALAAKFNLPAAGRWVMQAARLQRFKGQHHLVRAVATLPPDQADVQAVIVGGSLFGMEQDYQKELRELAAGLGVAGRVHFTGFVSDDELRGLIAASEVVVHPAHDEDFGLIVAEAQAMERPVVAFAAVGPAAIVEDGRTGRLVPVGDQAGLDRALSDVLADRGLREAYGRAGRERVLRLFAADQAGTRLARIYEAVLARRQPRLAADLQPLLADA